jgi:outer membrane lipoprotein SlyB
LKYLGVALAGLLTLVACTTTDEIIIDEKSVDMNAYRQDLAECKTYAAQVKTEAKGAKGAASGAVIGGAIGAITGGAHGAAQGAGVGAVGGGAKGLEEGSRTEVDVVKRCLAGRGYHILN